MVYSIASYRFVPAILDAASGSVVSLWKLCLSNPGAEISAYLSAVLFIYEVASSCTLLNAFVTDVREFRVVSARAASAPKSLRVFHDYCPIMRRCGWRMDQESEQDAGARSHADPAPRGRWLGRCRDMPSSCRQCGFSRHC